MQHSLLVFFQVFFLLKTVVAVQMLRRCRFALCVPSSHPLVERLRLHPSDAAAVRSLFAADTDRATSAAFVAAYNQTLEAEGLPLEEWRSF